MNKIFSILIACILASSLLPAQDWTRLLIDLHSNQPNKIRTLPNGDFVLCGVSFNLGLSGSGGFLLRTDPVGNPIWFKTVGDIDGQGDFKNYDRFEDLILTNDGSIIAVGSQGIPVPNAPAHSNLLICKFDLDGTEIWRKQLNYRLVDEALGVAAMPDGSFVVCGKTTNLVYNYGDGFLLKMNPNGDVQWIKYYDQDHTDDILSAVILTSSQQLLAIGTTTFPSGGRVMAIQTDLDGNQDWLNTYPEYSVMGNSIVENQNGQFGICGRSFTDGFSFDNLIMQIDPFGAEIWNQHLHANAEVPDELFDLLPCAEGGYVTVGQSGLTYLDGYHILRVDEQGTVLNALYLYDGGQNLEAARSLTWASEGGIVVTGVRHSPGGTCGHDDLLMNYFSDLGCSQPTSAVTIAPALEINVSPNPAHDFIQVDASQWEATTYQFSLTDAMGRLIINTLSKESKFSIACQQVPPGVYFYALALPDGRLATGKLILE